MQNAVHEEEKPGRFRFGGERDGALVNNFTANERFKDYFFIKQRRLFRKAADGFHRRYVVFRRQPGRGRVFRDVK